MLLLLLAACTGGDRDPDPLDPDVLPVTEGSWIRPDVRTTWQIQLQAPLDTSVDADLYVVDLYDTTDVEIDALHADDRVVVCYTSAGTGELWRDDVADLPARVLGEAVSGYPEERWLDIRHPAVHRLLQDRIDLAVARGCDGVDFDNVDGYRAATGFDLSARDQLAYDRFLFNAAHQSGLMTTLKNDLEQVPELVDYVDAAIVEECHARGECAGYQPFLDAGKPVFDAEYVAPNGPAALCRDALLAGTRTLLLPLLLDGSSRVSCDTDLPSTTHLAHVRTYTTYYGRDPSALAALADRDLAIVQPLLTADQRSALQSTTTVVAYLSIGEIGLSNTYIVDGAEVPGQVVYDAHPEWFLAQNPNFDSWFADAGDPGWQDFVLGQADLLLGQGYDGLFFDTVDTVDVYPETAPGMVELIGRLRAAHPDASFVQNRGLSVLPESGPDVDAVMFEVFSTRYDFEAGGYAPTDTAAPGYAGLVVNALDYRLAGGVVLAQDFAEPGGAWDDLVCYARDRALDHRFVPSYADKFFQGGAYDYPSACPWPAEPAPRLVFDPPLVHVRAGGSATVDVSLVDGATAWSVGTLPAGIGASVAGARMTVTASGGPGTVVVPIHSGDRTYGLRVDVHAETIWVTNAGLSDVVAFDEPAAATGLVTPDRRTPATVAQPYAVAIGPDGTRWVVENVGDPAASQPAGRLLGYAPFILGSPVKVIDGLSYPTGLAVDALGTVWVASAALDWTGTPRGTPTIAKVAAGATAVSAGFDLDFGAYGYPRSLAFDASGDLWMTTTYGLVLGFVPGAGTVAPFAVLAGTGGTGDDVFDTVNALAFDASGDLWVTGSYAGVGQIVQIPSGSWTTDGLVSRIDGDVAEVIASGLYAPWGLAFDAAGDLWVVDSTDAADTRGALVRFDLPATTPAQVIPLESRYTLGIAIAAP